ncbi:MAG: hypothetical protein R3F62_29740 [Planctomycetota bacterium]
MQNIKGTGLDFALRWVRQGAIDRALGRLSSFNPTVQARSLESLRQLQDLVDFEVDLIRRGIQDVLQGELSLTFRRELTSYLESLPAADAGQPTLPQPDEATPKHVPAWLKLLTLRAGRSQRGWAALARRAGSAPRRWEGGPWRGGGRAHRGAAVGGRADAV